MLNNDFILSLFMDTLRVSVLASVVILLILAISPVMEKRHTVSWRYLLWAVLAVRLALPFDAAVPGKSLQFSIPVSVTARQDINSFGREVEQKESFLENQSEGEKTEILPERQGKQTRKEEQDIEQKKETAENITPQDKKLTVNSLQGKSQTEHLQESEAYGLEAGWKVILRGASLLWAAGVCLCLAWHAVCYRSYRRKLEKQKIFYTQKGLLPVYLCQGAVSPMLIGLRKPQILLPVAEYGREQLEFILEHEFTHYKRKDLWMKCLLAVAKAIHWFNPMVAWMERQAAQDIEFLCDSQVVKQFTKEEKKRYSETLLACAVSPKGRNHMLCTSEFSRDADTLKKRFENIFSGKRKRGIFPAVLGIGILAFLSFFVVFGVSEKSFAGGGDGMALTASGKNRQGINMAPLLQRYDKIQQEFDKLQQEAAEQDSSQKVLGEVVEKEYLYEDEEGWKYYLEEDKGQESRLQGVAMVQEPLLLVRYHEQRRQVLEDLIVQETWMECPVLFVDGRIVYKAAPNPDIIGIKDPVLVSIAMDGSDRRTADTILYHVVDNLCEDDGWIYYSGWANDYEFPKPLCRISPDFSSGPQLVQELPGLLCGVKDGNVYYLASKEKDAGIWKRNLSTGEEQIYDKWGEPAENFYSFYAREWEYPAGELREQESTGCKIQFQYDDEDEMTVLDVVFE